MLQTVFETQLDQYLKKFVVGEESPDEHVCQSILREIEDEFSQARERHERIVISKSSDSLKKYVEDNVFSGVREKYHTLWGKLHAVIPKNPFPQDILNATMSIPQCKSTSELKLVKVELPTFSGKYDEWMAFNNMFTATVHNNP